MIKANPELQKRYYRSFISYEIPLKPDGQLRYADTQAMSSYYVTLCDQDGRTIEFVKILLVAEDIRTIGLPEKAEPGSDLYFRAVRGTDTTDAGPGQRIEYADTENLPEFVRVVVDNTGSVGQAVLLRKQAFFKESYLYWPNGHLRQRELQRRDNRRSTWNYADERSGAENPPHRNGEAADPNCEA